MSEDHILNDEGIATISDQRNSFADRLAEKYGQASPHDPGHSIVTDLTTYKDWLAQAHAYFRDASQEQLTLTYNSEWILDNYYIIRQALRQIKEDLPQGFYTQLPKLTSGPLKGFARIHLITRDMLAHQNLLMNINDMQALLDQLQETVPLTMGELWAVPIFLRFGLIEALSLALVQNLDGETQPKIPIRTPVTDTEIGEQAWTNAAKKPLVQGGDANAVANAILSLRAISEQD